MVNLSPINKMRLYAVLFLAITNLYIYLLLDAERQLKISLTYYLMIVTAVFIVWRGRTIRKREEQPDWL